MKDQDVRRAFHQGILHYAHHSEHTFVIDEFGLKNGQSRADIAVLNGKFVGYEIKTDSDTLNRLSSQMSAYNEVFDEVFIITGKKHLSTALEIIPHWWGVYLIEGNELNYSFERLRDSTTNDNKNCFGLAQLLWKDEVTDILSNIYGLSIKSKIDKHRLYNLLVETSNAHELTNIALRYLKKRQGWRINL